MLTYPLLKVYFLKDKHQLCQLTFGHEFGQCYPSALSAIPLRGTFPGAHFLHTSPPPPAGGLREDPVGANMYGHREPRKPALKIPRETPFVLARHGDLPL